MSKLFGERMVTKHEIYHIMLNTPTIHCSHTEFNIDLRNKYCLIESELDSSDDDNVFVTSRTDEYSERLDTEL